MNKVKVTYEEVEMSLNDIAKAMIDGEVFYNENGRISFSWVNYKFLNSNRDIINLEGEFYRKVETQVPWYENIPVDGVMCKVGDYKLTHNFQVITKRALTQGHWYFYDAQCVTWKYAEPVNKSDYNFAEDL